MNKPKVSVVIPTHNRARYFERSLKCYAQQEFKDFEIILLDDDSTDGMEYCCRKLAPDLGLDLKQFFFKKPAGMGYRDGACMVNYGIRASVGKLIITTCPEVMPGKTSILEIVQHFERFGWERPDWISCKAYLMTARHQSVIDTVDWVTLGAPVAIRTLPDFYNVPPADYQRLPQFAPSNIDREPQFGCSIFCGMSRRGWREIGGFPESEVWGSPDTSFQSERWRRNTPSFSCQLPESTCVHQFHDMPGDIHSPRDSDKCLQNNLAGPWDFINW